MKHELKRKPDVQKTTMLAIVVNAVQIGVLFAFVLYVLTAGAEARNSWSLQFMVIAGALMAAWGAGVDIQDALRTRRLERTIGELQTTNEQMDALNLKLRAQRHDFMNHIQVVYSLIEMNEPGEAMTYMDKLYGDMQRVSRMMRTACPAVNALIQAKVVEARQRGAELKLSIAAKWDDPLMPAWEICRVLANLIDNALDAATSAQLPEGEKPTVELVLGEDLRSWFFSVRNNGPAIPEKQRAKIFEPGFTTKRTGQGMGLFIVNQTVAELGGRITVDSRDGDTVFSGFVPRKRLKLGDGETAQSDENTDIYEENAKKDDNSINKSDANS